MSQWSDHCLKEHWDPFDLEQVESFDSFLATGSILKNNRVRTVRRMPQGVLKEYKNFWGLKKAYREFENLKKAQSLSLPVPQVYWYCLLFGRPFLLMEDLGHLPTLLDVSCERTLENSELEALGRLCEKLIASGCLHRDFHSGNLLLSGKVFSLLDLDNVVFRPGPLFSFEVIRLLSGLYASLEPLNQTQHHLWLSQALPHMNHDEIKCFQESLIEKRWKIWEKHFASRGRKALKNSGTWAQDPCEGLRIRRRTLDSKVVSQLISKTPVDFLKQDTKTCLWRDHLEEKPVVLKKFVQVQPFRRFMWKTRSRFSWLNSVQLEVRDLPAPRPLVFQENRDGSGLVVIEEVAGALGLDRWLWENWDQLSLQQRQDEVNQFAQFVCKFFEKRTLPKDFKACNVMRLEETYSLVDHDNISFPKHITSDDFVKLFSQLHLSITKKISWRYRWAALKKIVKDHKEAKIIWRRVLEQTARQPILFQTAQGDQQEVL